MADYTTLKTAVQIAIKTNNNNEITGKILQQQLLAMINSLGSDYQLAGILRPLDTPKTGDQRIAYLAVEPGMYENAGGFEVTELSLLMYDTAWEVHPLGVPFGSQVAAAIKALQDADKANAKAIADEKASRTTAILAEQQEREQADTTLQENIDKKQDTISDLTTIRTQAAHGQTAFSWGDHSKVGYITGITKAMVEDVLTGNITSHTHTFASLTDKPTTISGYGIRDAYTKAETDRKVVELQGLIDSMFERIYDSNNKLIRVHSNVTISSSGDLVAGSNSGGGGTSGGGKNYLNELLDVQLATSSLSEGDMLMWNGVKYVNIPQSSITPDLSAYATQQWVLDKKYLTSVPVASVVGQTGNITTAQVATALTDAGYKLTDTTYELATTTSNGLMSVTDKKKLDGIAENANNYTLPTASSSAKGGIKVGTTLSISGEVLNLKSGFPKGTYTKVQIDDYGRVVSGNTLSASDIPSLPWSKITSGKPTTISGYGITDAYTKTETDNKVAELQSLLDSMFERVYDSNNTLIRVHSNVTISSSGDIVAGGDSGGGTPSGGTFTQLEWNAIKALTQSESGLLASAYAVKEAYNELNTAIETLAGKATNVKFTQTLTSGKQIGSISIDGKSTSLFAPANYAWSEVSDRPTKLSQFTDDVVSGKYLPLSGGTMSNTNVVTNLNADLLDGYNSDSFAKRLYLGTTDLNSIGDSLLGDQTGNANATADRHYPIVEAGGLISILSAYNSTNQIYGTFSSNRWFARGAGTGLSSRTSWREFAFLDSNVASSSKWANPRTITLTGSVTGSVSIDGSQNVSLATTTNHTHTFASLTDKPTTISGYGITDGLRRVTLANNVENDFNTFENLTLTGRGDPTTGSSLLNSPWATQPAGGFGVLTYLWSAYGFQLAVGYNSNDLYIRKKYYTGSGYSWDTRWDKILNSSNYNSYVPKLDGTGATGTWGINISGNASSATNADTLDGYHASAFSLAGHTHSYIPLSDKGLSNGKVPYYVEFPSFNALVSLGYNEESTKNYDEYYCKGLCKWAIDNFAGQGNILLIGNALPNSIGYCCIQLYSNEGKDANTGLPRYCSGTYISLDRATTNFSCNDYVWNWGGSFGGNASTATKLANSRTIWGQSFDGTGNVDGSLHIYSTGSSWNEGIRMHAASDGWSGVVMCGSDNTGATGTSPNTWGVHNNEGNLYINRNGSNAATPYILCNIGGNWGIGTNSPSYKLHIVGTAYASENIIAGGDLTAGSDIRYKDKIQDLRLSVHDIALAPAFTYKWNNREDDALVHIGSSAQYWLNTNAKDAVYYDKQNDFYHLNYASLALCNTIILARGMETQEEKIARLEERINELEDKLRQYDSCR